MVFMASHKTWRRCQQASKIGIPNSKSVWTTICAGNTCTKAEGSRVRLQHPGAERYKGGWFLISPCHPPPHPAWKETCSRWEKKRQRTAMSPGADMSTRPRQWAPAQVSPGVPDLTLACPQAGSRGPRVPVWSARAAWSQVPGPLRYRLVLVCPGSKLAYKDPGFRPNTAVTMPASGDPDTRPAPSGTQHQGNPHIGRTKSIPVDPDVRLTLKQGQLLQAQVHTHPSSSLAVMDPGSRPVPTDPFARPAPVFLSTWSASVDQGSQTQVAGPPLRPRPQHQVGPCKHTIL